MERIKDVWKWNLFLGIWVDICYAHKTRIAIVSCTKDLKLILKYKLTYDDLYDFFERAYEVNERHPQKWYDKYVSIESVYTSKLCADGELPMVADPIMHS